MKRIIVIGATGHFGGRICRRVAGEPNTELLVTSRSKARADRLRTELLSFNDRWPVRSAKLDQDGASFERDLHELRPDIVIHTAGPYQGQRYKVAEACIASGSHYIDLADGRDFVQGFNGLDDAARRRDVLLVSGASTLPGLSSAVIDHLSDRFSRIDTIEISIAPAHQTPRGRATIAAVLSYCGSPFDVLIEGQWVTRFGWQDIRRQAYPELGSRLAAACDVPDLGLLPAYVDGVRTVTFHAALEARREQVALWLLAWARRAGIIKSWVTWVPRMQRISERLIGRGSDVGGMQIRLLGQSIDQQSRSIVWNLVARRNHGPEIPCSPALILARKLAADTIALRGAMPCLGMFSMADFDAEVSDLDIGWCIDETAG